MSRAARRAAAALLAALAWSAGHAGEPAAATVPAAGGADETAEAAAPPASASDAAADATADALPRATRSGREIYARFREGLAAPACEREPSERWQRHFAGAPKRLVSGSDDVLPLFGYVVDALREAHLPTEYALIPFVESGYRPGARSGAGPAGLWQFIALTARDRGIPVRPGYDGRLSPVESTRAAVHYLRTLHGMFAGDWRLAVMAYNAGEYRVLGALRKSGQRAADARPDELPGLSGITRAYVRKLHALSCVLDRADDNEQWRQALDREVAVLAPTPLDARSLDEWARVRGLDATALKRINPALAGARIASAKAPPLVLAPVVAQTAPEAIRTAATATSAAPPGQTTTLADAEDAIVIPPPPEAGSSGPRTHTVERGDSIWRLARRYDVSRAELLARNGLDAEAVLRPGMVLRIDDAGDVATGAGTAGAVSSVPE